MDREAMVYAVTVLVAVLGMALGIIFPALGQSNVGGKALESMARQPQSSDSIRLSLFVTLAMLESLAIYVLVVVLIILFANPLFSLIGL